MTRDRERLVSLITGNNTFQNIFCSKHFDGSKQSTQMLFYISQLSGMPQVFFPTETQSVYMYFKATYLRNVVTKGKRGTFSVLPLLTIILQLILNNEISQSC